MNQITSLKIKGLFGRHDYEFDFESKKGFSILAAPNGYGKSTVLKIIRAIACMNVFYFYELKFDSIYAEFNDHRNHEISVSIKKEWKVVAKDERAELIDQYRKLMESAESVPEESQRAVLLGAANALLATIKKMDSENIRSRKESFFIPLRNSLIHTGASAFTGDIQDSGEYELCIQVIDSRKPLHAASDFIKKAPHTVSVTKEDVDLFVNALGDKIEGLERVPAAEKVLSIPTWKRVGLNDDKKIFLSDIYFEHRMLCIEQMTGDWKKVPRLAQLLDFDCLYIGANRLVSSSNALNNVVFNVQEVKRLLKKCGDAAKQEYGRISSYCDDRLVKQLIDVLPKSGGTLTLRKSVEEKLKKLKAARNRNIKYKISLKEEDDKVPTNQSIENLDHAALVVLDTVYENALKKQEVYDKLIEKMDYFAQVLSDLLSYITIKVDMDGFHVRAEGQENELPLEVLSSGEQQLIILLGVMLFYDKMLVERDSNFASAIGIAFSEMFGSIEDMFAPSSKNVARTLVLIDEPEISMHPEWQEAISDFLFKVQKDFGRNFVVATHSPTFVGDHWDKVFELSRLEKAQKNG